MSEQPNITPQDVPRAAEWSVDRQIESAPLPYSHVSHYEDDGQRQVDLAAAERANIARAAGELGLTSGEWHAKRAELGRSPNASDIKK